MLSTDWNGRAIELARSAGGVFACRNPWDGVMRGDVTPWPPPELVQKLYHSRQARAYHGDDHAAVTAAHGYYADLQSVHSEDALTWSMIGPLVYASPAVRAAYAGDLLQALLGEAVPVSAAHLWLWRRLPHPDTLVPGGPEIDFGVQTDDTLVLGEAKWRSSVGAKQGKGGDQDQIQLRVAFCEKYGAVLYPGVRRFVILLVAPAQATMSEAYRALRTDRVRVVRASWEDVGGLPSNPWRDEFLLHLGWRREHSRPAGNAVRKADTGAMPSGRGSKPRAGG